MLNRLIGLHRLYLGSMGGINPSISSVTPPLKAPQTGVTTKTVQPDPSSQPTVTPSPDTEQTVTMFKDTMKLRDAGILNKSETKLIDALVETTRSTGALPSTDELNQLRAIVDKCSNVLRGELPESSEVQNVTKKFTIKGHGFGDKSLNTLIKDKKGLENQIKEARDEIATLKGEKTLLSDDKELLKVDVRIAQLEQGINVNEAKLKHIDERLAGDKKTPPEVLVALAERMGSDPEIQKQLLNNPNIPAEALDAIVKQDPSTETCMKVAKHPTTAKETVAYIAQCLVTNKYADLGLGDERDVSALRKKQLALQSLYNSVPQAPELQELKQQISSVGHQVDDDIKKLQLEGQHQNLDTIVTTDLKQKGKEIQELQLEITNTGDPTRVDELKSQVKKLKSQLVQDVYKNFSEFARNAQVRYSPTAPPPPPANLLGGDQNVMCGNISGAFKTCLVEAGLTDTTTTGVGMKFLTNPLDDSFIDPTAMGSVKTDQDNFGEVKRYLFTEHSVTVIPDVGVFDPTSGKFAEDMDQLKEQIVAVELIKGPEIGTFVSTDGTCKFIGDGQSPGGGGAYKLVEGQIPQVTKV